MMKFKEKEGFSLAESIISMILLALVILLTMATLTRKKPVPLNKVTISGIYACWIDSDGRKKDRFFDGHRQVYTNTDKCEFEMDRRAYKYYIFAAGANNDCELVRGEQQCIEGQVTQRYIEAPSGANENEMKLDFTIGNQTNGNTKVMQNGNNILEALGNITTGVTYGNLKRCKFIESSDCEDNKCSTTNGIKTPCESGEKPICNIDANGQSINIACMSVQNEGQREETALAIQDHSCQLQEFSYQSENNYIKGKCIRSDGAYRGIVKVNVERIDSSIKNKRVVLSEAKIVKILKMLPESIQNGLTDELLKYYQDPSKPKKNGVVLIIW